MRLFLPLKDARSLRPQTSCIIDYMRDQENRRVHQVKGIHVWIESQAGLVGSRPHIVKHVIDEPVMLLKAILGTKTEVLFLQIEPLLLYVCHLAGCP